MANPTSNLRGILLMVLGTLVFTINDTFLKLVTEGLPPYQVLFLRGIAATIWCVPLVVLTGNARHIAKVVDRWVLLRNTMEMLAVFCFIVALANMPIGDVAALGQVAPLLVLVGAAVVYGERVGTMRMVLIALGFAGAILVVQPSLSGVSVFALLGLGNAVGVALRDLASRKVAPEVPGFIVALSAIWVVLIGAGGAHFAFEEWRTPEPVHLLLLLGSGFFLTFGHLCVFLAYRYAATKAVAPFIYMVMVWAVMSGIIVFGTFPNTLAVIGILFIVASGLALVLLDSRRGAGAATLIAAAGPDETRV